MTEALVVFITVDSHEHARRIAEALVTERLAACVNIIPNIESVYWWEGKVCSDAELLLIAKTERQQYAQLEAKIKAIHTYTTPEIIALPVAYGSEPYLKWLHNSVS